MKIFSPSGQRLWLNRLLIIAFLFFAQETFGQDKADRLRFVAIWAGVLPIVLSAPHGGRDPIPGISVRKGQGVAQFATERDSNTAELAEQIAVTLDSQMGGRPFLVVARFERKYVDANRAPAEAYEDPSARFYYDAYHHALEQACGSIRNRWGRGLLIDLHGQGVEKETIFGGTAKGLSMVHLEHRFGREAIAGSKSILGQLVTKGYKVAPESLSGTERRFTGGFIVRNYGSHRATGIDAIQLEFGSALRERHNLNRTADDLAEAIAVFAREYLPRRLES